MYACAEDIIQSFLGTQGYYAQLKTDHKLKTNFDDAVFEIFSSVIK